MVTEEIQRQILEKNNNLGIKTFFYYGESGILGYTEDNSVYINLNENTDESVNKTNNHEILHHFEETEEFKRYKNEILQEEDIEELRENYFLKYYGIYTEEEIQAGVIDTEIAIDKIIEKNKVEDFLGLEEKEIENRRYLSLQVKNNIANLNGLSNWDKIFAENYYGKRSFSSEEPKSMPQKGEKVEQIKQDVKTELEALYNLVEEPDNFKIDVNSKEIIREYENKIKALEARGEKEKADNLRRNEEIEKQKIAERISQNLYEEYKHIVDTIKVLEYEDSFKALMLRETLTKSYKKDVGENKNDTIVKNRDLHKSISEMMTLNETVLKTIHDNLDDYDNFANLYYAGIALSNEQSVQKSEVSLDGVKTYGKGRWIEFEGKASNEEEYLKNSQELSALVSETSWCTKIIASSQLEDGDFYVFVDEENKPHIAVELCEDIIEEVRGIKGEKEQAIEEEFRDVAISFLENNKDKKCGKEWLESEEWNQEITALRKKIENGDFKVEDVKELNDIMFGKDKTFIPHGGSKNSNKEELKQKLELVKDKIAKYYNCKEEEIYTGDIEFSDKDYETVQFRIIYGDVNFGYSRITNLGKLQCIGGNADFCCSEVTDLGALQCIGGDARFYDSEITNLKELQSIGGNANFEHTKIIDLGALKSIGGSVFLSSELRDLGNLQNIGGDVDFKHTKITNLGTLQSIGGNARFACSSVINLGELKNIGGDASFCDSNITDLGELQNIGGYADFEHSGITNLGKLRNIGDEIFDNEYNLAEQYKEIKEREKISNKIKVLENLEKENNRLTEEKEKLTDMKIEKDEH